ncbi:MAG: long-chain fatty acid--CoA ligase [Sphingobium sp.]|nr:long-chain fatty acid--CoA ligase [Sphingobium sp.]MCP5400730.1 long-chain fatty acid--CoA ligase [Sphingomonas sp.]
MQDRGFRVTQILDHAAREHGSRELVTRWADGSETRTTWAEVRHDALRMTQALRRVGVQPGDRVATLAMNHVHHLISWYGVIGAGGVIHTLNPRLFDEQLDYIVNHAEDLVLLYDASLQPVVERMKSRWPTVKHYICFDNGEFADWIGAEDGEATWTEGDERDPCMLCYTSGTTGNPKGVLYEHRSTTIHALASLQPDCFHIEVSAVILPVVPMFHAACWSLPWGAGAAGAKLVFSMVNDPAVLCDLFAKEGVTHTAGVPTVWLSVFEHLDATGGDFGRLKKVMCGGTAMPRFMIERFMRAGVDVMHLWGMTETSPIGTAGYRPWNWDQLSFDEQVDIKSRQGRAPFGVELRCVDLDDPAKILPRDGTTSGALQIRGPWIVKRYFKAEMDAAPDPENWFNTGDVAVIHPDGTLQLTDRTKDVIKSGGEWISSVELENAAMAFPGVAEAACIGIYHPKWDERPVLVVVKKPGADVSGEDLIAHLAQQVAKWWLPDAVEFVDELPHTGTGKVSKKDLRDQFSDYKLVTGVPSEQ